jgi:hypothetical protein
VTTKLAKLQKSTTRTHSLQRFPTSNLDKWTDATQALRLHKATKNGKLRAQAIRSPASALTVRAREQHFKDMVHTTLRQKKILKTASQQQTVRMRIKKREREVNSNVVSGDEEWNLNNISGAAMYAEQQDRQGCRCNRQQ